jgi:hypothetical protein
MRLPIIGLLVLFGACSQEQQPGQKVVAKKKILPGFRSTDSIFKYVLLTDTANVNQGDTLTFLYGHLFDKKLKHILICNSDTGFAARYKIYVQYGKTWILMLSDSVKYEDINYSISDWNFDGINDFTFIKNVNINGCNWNVLYVYKNNAFLKIDSFNNIPRPSIDSVRKLIRGIFIGGLYDQHSKELFSIKDTTLRWLELVTIEPVWNDSIEPQYNETRYYKIINGKMHLRQRWIKNDTIFDHLLFEDGF